MPPPLRVAFAPRRAGGNPYLDDLAAHLDPAEVVEVAATWDEVAGRGAARPADVVHLHWLPMVLAEQGPASPRRTAIRYLRRLARLRQRGVGVVWTMHNLASHETADPRLDRLVRRATALAATRVVVHCEVARRELRRLWPPAHAVVVPHPCHPGPAPDRLAARRRLGLPAEGRVVSVPGRIREYKDVAGMVGALRRAAGPDDVIVVAGQPHGDHLAQAVVAAAADDRRVRLDLRVLAEAEMRDVIAAADVVALPYRRVLTSGAAILALELGVPVVAPRLGCLPEEAGDGALLHAAGDHDEAARLAIGTSVAELRRRGEAGRRTVLQTTWAAAGRRHAAVYREAARRR